MQSARQGPVPGRVMSLLIVQVQCKVPPYYKSARSSQRSAKCHRAGAVINGTGFDAANLTTTPAAAGASRTRQFNGTDGNLSTAAAAGSFGSALDLNPDGTFNSTAGQPVSHDNN